MRGDEGKQTPNPPRKALKGENDDLTGSPELVASLRLAHPYGARPQGDLWLRLGERTSDQQGPAFAAAGSLQQLRLATSDDPFLGVLAFLSGFELGRVVQTGRCLYVFGHTPELWRDAYMRHFCPEEGHQGPAPTVQYHGTWRDSFALSCGAAGPHHPQRMSGVYSSTLHRSWCCGNFEVRGSPRRPDSHSPTRPPRAGLVLVSRNVSRTTPQTLTPFGSCAGNAQVCPEWMEVNTVPKRHVSDLSPEDFEDQYERGNTPVVLQGALETWSALQNWQVGAFGGVRARATDIDRPTDRPTYRRWPSRLSCSFACGGVWDRATNTWIACAGMPRSEPHRPLPQPALCTFG